MSSFISTLLLLLLLLLCHAMHGCDGRRLGGLRKESHKHVHHSSKDLEKISKEKISLLKELIPMRKHRKTATKSNERVVNDHQNGDGARTPKQMKNPNPVGLLKDEVEETKQSNTGSTTTEISMFSDEGFQQSTKIEGPERRGRSVLGSQSHITDENVDRSKENGDFGVSEDIVAMDYEQPHKKPPIHNFSP